MGRHPDGATARTEWLKLRITPEDRAEIDRARGDLSRSAFVREAVVVHIRRLDTNQLTGKAKR